MVVARQLFTPTRRFMEMMPKGHVIAKLDFSNAFNSLHRDAMLEAVYNKSTRNLQILSFILQPLFYSSIWKLDNIIARRLAAGRPYRSSPFLCHSATTITVII